jgi:hypothetical protein
LEAVYVSLAIVLGLAIDWAVFERLTMILGAVGAPKEDHAYRDLLFPRVIITVISSVAIAIGILSEPERAMLTIAGTAIFAAANLCAVFKFLRGDLGR